MIIVKLISGLGNQLFQYAVARQLSIINNTSLKLDVSFYDSQDLRSFKLNNYNIKADMATPDEVDDIMGVYHNRNLYSKCFRRIERLLPKNYKRYYLEGEWWIYEPELFEVFGNAYLEGYWQHYKYFQKFDKQIFDELTIKDTQTQSVDYLSLVNIVNGDPASVSLHIRRGDYISDKNANDLMGVLPIEYYIDAVDYILKAHKNASFYIFSDDLDWVKDNLEIPAPVNYVEIDGGKRDFLELDLMSKCHHNIIANSSFSWWGAFLNQHPNKIVIAPDSWVKPIEVNKKINIQMPDWVKM